MTRTMGANIVCRPCGAMPYPPPGARENFDLLKLKLVKREGDSEGKKPAARWQAAGEGEGEWFCSRCREWSDDGWKVVPMTEASS
jgi:hypothetical protein